MEGLSLETDHMLRGMPVWRTPLIPLPAALLYPGRRLPLHLRGDRYRHLVQGARKEHGLVSIATLREGEDQPVYDVVGVGQVIDSITFPDGVHVTFQGISRGRVVAEEAGDHYRIALVSPLTETRADAEAEKELAGLLDEVGGLGPLVRRIGRTDSPGQVADLINAHLPHPVGTRQEIFEILDVVTRIRRVRNLLQQVRARRGGYHPRLAFPS